MKSAAKPVVLLIIFAAFSTLSILGFNIKLIKKIKLSQETTLLGNPWSFCVTEDKLFLIPDYKTGNIKIYDSNGKSVIVLGRKGYGPGEFVRPTFCYYNKAETKFGIIDHGIRKIFIYKRTGKKNFKRIKEVSCLSGTHDIQFKGNELLISGYKSASNGNPYDLYYIDLSNNQATLLLPSYYRYGLNSFHEYETQYRRKPNIKAIGIRGWFDSFGDDVYFTWEGDLTVIKINTKSGKLSFFGKKTPNYVKPFASINLLNAHRNRDINIKRSEKAKMSYIRNIFANSNYVLVIYDGPIKKDRDSNFRMQFYTLDGNFLEEMPIPGKPGYRMWMDKEREILCSLTSELDDDLNEEYFFLEYKITDQKMVKK